MDYENPYIADLTFSECGRWSDKDSAGFQSWCRRMMAVDLHFLETGKKLPRHRFNRDPDKP
jgi:hypothetical protein